VCRASSGDGGVGQLAGRVARAPTTATSLVFGFRCYAPTPMPSSSYAVGTDEAPHLPRVSIKAVTRRTSSGACFRVEQEPVPQACPNSSAWMANWLHESKMKAFTSETNLQDPKQRRSGNLISAWCGGDDFKLWDTVERRPVASYAARAAYAEHII